MVSVGAGSLIETDTAPVAVPPGPVQASVNDVAVVSGNEASAPEVPRLPLQPPLAVQDVASLVVQAS